MVLDMQEKPDDSFLFSASKYSSNQEEAPVRGYGVEVQRQFWFYAIEYSGDVFLSPSPFFAIVLLTKALKRAERKMRGVPLDLCRMGRGQEI